VLERESLRKEYIIFNLLAVVIEPLQLNNEGTGTLFNREALLGIAFSVTV
jgi:hypothetical protein